MKIIKSIKNRIFITAIAIVFALGCFPIFELSNLYSYAYNPTSISITNAEFDNYSGSDYPKTPTSWTKNSANSTSSSIITGVVNTDTEEFVDNQEEYGLATLPDNSSNSSDKKNVLMINSGLTASSYAYNSTSFTLSRDSFYIITVQVLTSAKVWTQSNPEIAISSTASLVLDGIDNSSITNINTMGNWDTYSFYVETNQFTNKTVTLQLWLGSATSTSAGAVLFDKISATRFDQTEFNIRKSATSFVDMTNKYISLIDTTIDVDTKINNPSFATDLTDWAMASNEESDLTGVFTGRTAVDSTYSSATTHVTNNPFTNLRADDNYALFINNTSPAGTTYTSNEFTIERQSYYLISIWAKTGTFDEGGATISLVPTSEDLSATSITNIATTTTTNSITNNWTKYSIYVLGSPFGDEVVTLSLGLGSTAEDDLVEGYVFFDDITVTNINYAQYTNATADSSNVKAQLFTSGTTPTIANAYFNFASTSYDGIYPLAPASWTVGNEDNTTSGIICTNATHFNANSSQYGSIQLSDIGFTPLQYDTNETTANNNLMMIRNSIPSYQSYTSSTYSLSTSSYITVSVDAKAYNGSVAYIKILSGNTILSEFRVDNDTEWKTYITNIYSGLTSHTITIEIGLGSETNLVSGYAFFDNVRLTTSDNNNFVDITETANNVKIDLSSEEFTLLDDETDGELVVPTNWTTSISSANADAIDAGVAVDESNGNVLTIVSTNANNQQQYTSNFTYTLDSATYYKVVFTINSSNLSGLADSGLEFGFTENSTIFTNITPTEFTEYTFYINGASLSSITPFIKLVSINATNTVSAMLKSIKISVITEVEYADIVEELESDEPPTTALALGNVEEEGDDETTTASYNNTFDWLIIPSLIISLAVVMAVVGFSLRKTKFKKHSKKSVSTYDRNRTLHPQLLSKEIENARNARLEELQNKLLANKKELEEYELQYKNKLQAITDAKETKKQESEFKKYAKGRRKLAVEQEKLESEVEFVTSEEFAQETEKKLAKATTDDTDKTINNDEVSSESNNPETTIQPNEIDSNNNNDENK